MLLDLLLCMHKIFLGTLIFQVQTTNILQIALTNRRTRHTQKNGREVWLYKQAHFDTANITRDVNNFWMEWSDVFITVIRDTIPTCQSPSWCESILTDRERESLNYFYQV